MYVNTYMEDTYPIISSYKFCVGIGCWRFRWDWIRRCCCISTHTGARINICILFIRYLSFCGFSGFISRIIKSIYFSIWGIGYFRWKNGRWFPFYDELLKVFHSFISYYWVEWDLVV